MKTIYKSLMSILLLSSSFFGYSQVTWVGNGGGTPGDYLGWDNATTFPLEIRHNGNKHLNLFTNSIHRIKLNPDVSYPINGHTANRNGYMLLGDSQTASNDDYFSEDTLGAFSLLHLNGPYNVSQAGYRPWMQHA